jgi:(2Fe-2S) ferredoxin
MNDSKDAAGPDIFERAGARGAARHVFVCIGPECCEQAEGERLWEWIKRRIKQEQVSAMRTKAACLRVCQGGPWLIVYPEGVWYGAVTPDRFDRILSEHLLGGAPVVEWAGFCNPLCAFPSAALPCGPGTGGQTPVPGAA